MSHADKVKRFAHSHDMSCKDLSPNQEKDVNFAYGLHAQEAGTGFLHETLCTYYKCNVLLS